MSHYFINDPSLKENIKIIDYKFKGRDLSFYTDNGLFSKDSVDYATNILLNEMPDITGKTLDLGCGYGVIGIALSYVNDIILTMSDVNEKAIDFSRKNCEMNYVYPEFILSDGFENIEDCFDNIILNPPIHAGKKTIFKMYEDGYEHLNNKGSFYLVIQKKHGADSSIKKLKDVYDEVEILYKKKGFYILKCSKIIDEWQK